MHKNTDSNFQMLHTNGMRGEVWGAHASEQGKVSPGGEMAGGNLFAVRMAQRAANRGGRWIARIRFHGAAGGTRKAMTSFGRKLAILQTDRYPVH